MHYIVDVTNQPRGYARTAREAVQMGASKVYLHEVDSTVVDLVTDGFVSWTYGFSSVDIKRVEG